MVVWVPCLIVPDRSQKGITTLTPGIFCMIGTSRYVRYELELPGETKILVLPVDAEVSGDCIAKASGDAQQCDDGSGADH